MNHKFLTAFVVAALAPLAAPSASYAQSAIAAAIDDPNRPPPDRVADADRKPADILAFAGIKRGDKVIDFMPGGGYYTRLLSKVVGPTGHVYALSPLIGPTPWSQAAKDAAAKSGRPVRNPVDATLSIQQTTAYGNVTALLVNVSGYGGTVPVAEQVDVVWTTDNYHDFHNPAPEALDMAIINKAIFRALKPGGTYFVVDHNAAKGAGFSQTQTLHRAEADAEKAEILAAGFEFVGESKVLERTGDDHSKPIFDPAIRGKTDQFVLKFRKPANASAQTKRHKDSDLANFYGNTLLLGPMLRIMWHPDHVYQEYSGNSKELTSGTWYSDADGHICLIHESILRSNGFTTCHPFEPEAIGKKVGDAWTEYGADGAPWQVSLAKGYVIN